MVPELHDLKKTIEKAHLSKYKKVDIKIFALPFIIITMVYLLLGYSTIYGIKDYYYGHKKEDALIVARTYSQSLSKSTKASEIVNELLSEKLIAAGQTTLLHQDSYGNEFLTELAKTLQVDEIYAYNPEGEIVYSTTPEFIGWKAPLGHPVDNFRRGYLPNLVENIRQDTVSKIYFKYAYFRSDDGSFVQIGVLADKVQNFLGSFEIQQILNDINVYEDSNAISFVDKDLKIIASTAKDLIGSEITRPEAKDEIPANNEYGYVKDEDGEEIYEIILPVPYEGHSIGTLVIKNSMRDTKNMVWRVTLVGLLTLTAIYASLLFTMLSIYRRNKNLLQLAYYDSLTGLPNKQFLEEMCVQDNEKNTNNSRAVMLINCSNFKLVNMTFGFELADQILKELSEKLQVLVDDNVKLFRFSGDRFILYVRNYNCIGSLNTFIQRVNGVFEQPYKINGAEQYLHAQIGIVKIDGKFDTIDRILKNVSIAISNIDSNSPRNYAYFNEEMENDLQREDIIYKELRTVIDRNDTDKLFLKYQPLADLRTNQIMGFEALVRMQSDHFGMVSPLEFIGIAERKQLIVPLSNLILHRACNFAKSMSDKGFEGMKVAVNISCIQLLREDFTQSVIEIITETGIPGSALELEITESVLADNYRNINEKLKILQSYGIDIALDDFGTGYSSFYRMSELNINTLKIDKHFIDYCSVKENEKLITGDIISMAHKLGLKVVAEGVELETQKEYLIENKCDIMQGYLFSEPLVEEDAIELCRKTLRINESQEGA